MIFGHTIVLIFYMQLSHYLIVRATQWWVYYYTFRLNLVKSFFKIYFKANLVRTKTTPVNGVDKMIFYAVIHRINKGINHITSLKIFCSLSK